MKLQASVRRAGLAMALLAASFCIVPTALARVHVGVGIAFPGISVGVGNCWRCGYWAAPPVYYAPAYPGPVYYPAPGYYAPPPVYYGYSYGYYAPYYYYYHRRYYGRDHDRGRRDRQHDQGGYYHHGHD
jgi:hypothetical protein